MLHVRNVLYNGVTTLAINGACAQMALKLQAAVNQKLLEIVLMLLFTQVQVSEDQAVTMQMFVVWDFITNCLEMFKTSKVDEHELNDLSLNFFLVIQYFTNY